MVQPEQYYRNIRRIASIESLCKSHKAIIFRDPLTGFIVAFLRRGLWERVNDRVVWTRDKAEKLALSFVDIPQVVPAKSSGKKCRTSGRRK